MDEKQYLTIFTYTPQKNIMPAMDYIIRISGGGSFIMYKHDNMICKSKLRSVIHNHTDRFTRVNQVTNALSFVEETPSK